MIDGDSRLGLDTNGQVCAIWNLKSSVSLEEIWEGIWEAAIEELPLDQWEQAGSSKERTIVWETRLVRDSLGGRQHGAAVLGRPNEFSWEGERSGGERKSSRFSVLSWYG